MPIQRQDTQLSFKKGTFYLVEQHNVSLKLNIRRTMGLNQYQKTNES